jgi:hypothetical protein
MSSGVNEVLSFLAGMFKDGKSYMTTNVHRSMFSSTLNLTALGLKDVGKHPLVIQLMKGIYQGKPSTPKYSTSWDPSVVINHFVSTIRLFNSYPTSPQNRRSISLNYTRCSEFNSIQLDSISFSVAKVCFNLVVLRKSQLSAGRAGRVKKTTYLSGGMPPLLLKKNGQPSVISQQFRRVYWLQ